MYLFSIAPTTKDCLSINTYTTTSGGVYTSVTNTGVVTYYYNDPSCDPQYYWTGYDTFSSIFEYLPSSVSYLAPSISTSNTIITNLAGVCYGVPQTTGTNTPNEFYTISCSPIIGAPSATATSQKQLPYVGVTYSKGLTFEL